MPWLLPLLLAVNPALWAPAGVFAGAVVAAAVTYLLGRRSASGTIDTSIASDLWSATDSLRKDLTEALREEREERKADRIRFTAELDAERNERVRLEGVNRELAATVAVQGARIADLEARLHE